MGRPKSKGAYVPLAAQYYMDDAILGLTPMAELLFVRILSFLASVPSDGFVTEKQLRSVVAIGLRNVPHLVTELTEAGLITAQDGGYVARSWHKWNRSVEEVGRLLAKDRERKARDSAEDAPNSARNPDGIQPDSKLQSSTEQSSTEQTSPNGDGGARKRATRIPEPFIVTAQMRADMHAECPGLDIDAHTKQFVDYWRGESGPRASKKNWVAAWRFWLRRDAEKIRGPALTRTEQNMTVVERIAAKEAAELKELAS